MTRIASRGLRLQCWDCSVVRFASKKADQGEPGSETVERFNEEKELFATIEEVGRTPGTGFADYVCPLIKHSCDTRRIMQTYLGYHPPNSTDERSSSWRQYSRNFCAERRWDKNTS